MQDHDVADLQQESPFSPRELVVSLLSAVLWVALAAGTAQLLMLRVQVV
ncbi:hypothetical protein [Rhodoferax saidenbachensis]|uniref:Uncharacterized protein n=1 Tax=Rhodoferax saidenbachensis TaxID=1484693 RepID=A0ABU1ZPB1_9BURK|nr:hypothetical protein [Rhodoferax saidenbachensis]MDR7307386.1 hypothetical protein [Rhodoferax saidenbachensis]